MEKSENQESINPMVGVNQFREMLYLFLSRAFSKEVDRAFLWNASKILNSLENLSGLREITHTEEIQSGQHLLREFFKEIEGKEQEKTLIDLSREYAVSFLGVVGETVALCESVYQGKTGSLFQGPYFEVKDRYAEIGMEKSKNFVEPDDHLSVELAYMATLCRLIIESGENGGTQLNYLKTQLEFLQKHLLLWVPGFLKRLKEAKVSTFYKAWGHILNGYLKLDVTLIGSLIQEVETEMKASGSDKKGKGVSKKR
jgi:TorA maturation chaperone TorD